MDMTKSWRIVLLGKTGTGKSSLANTIFGEEVFTINCTAVSETKTCQAKTKSVNGRCITLIDTPGFFDTDRSEEEMKPEIVKCVTVCDPGPHAFLILLKVDKYTEQEQAVIQKIHDYFSEEVFKYATVVFTRGDQLPEGKTIVNCVSQNQQLSDLVRKCGGRCHVFDNEYWNQNISDEYRSNRFQVEELLKSIDKTFLANRNCYTAEMLQAVREVKQQEEEHIRPSSGNTPEEVIREKDKDRVFRKRSLTSAESSRRIVLLGKSGAGKSSLANTIFGEEVFKVNHSFNSGTGKCEAKTKSVNGRSITLIDTPGFFSKDESDDIKLEILKCIIECAPGPHAFLILLQVEKYAEQEQVVIKKVLEYFSEEALKYATVVFTHGDQLSEGTTIEDHICQNELLSDLVRKCGGRCHVFDNKYWNQNTEDEYRSNRFHVEKLLNTIEETLQANNGRYYTNEMLRAVEEEIQLENEPQIGIFKSLKRFFIRLTGFRNSV